MTITSGTVFQTKKLIITSIISTCLFCFDLTLIRYIDGWGSSNLEINIQCHTNYNSSFCNNNRDPTILVTLTAGNCQTVYYEGMKF